MGLLRGIGRAAPLLAAGLAAGWYLRRQGLLGAPPQPELPWPPEPASPPPPAAVAEETRVADVVEPPPVAAETKMAEVVEPPQPEPGEAEPEEPIEVHVEAVEAVSDAADVSSVVEDLLAAEPEIVDAEVVEEGELDERIQAALAEMSVSVRVESYRGIVWLRGELEGGDAIEEAERRAASVSGVTEVRNLLHLPGTEPPAG